MRKVLLLGLGVGLCLAGAAGAQAGGQNEARNLIDKAIKARIGKGKPPALKAMQIKATGKLFAPVEATVTLELSVQPPDKQKAVVELDINGMTLSVVQVVNGKKGWKRIQGKTEALSEEEMKEVAQKNHVEKVTGLLELKGKGYEFSPLGELKVMDHDTVGVRVSKKGFRDVNLYLDKKTHVLRKAEYQAIEDSKEVNQEKFFLEYKEAAGGLKFPSKIEIHNDGKKTVVIEITETTFLDTALEDSVFAKPE